MRTRMAAPAKIRAIVPRLREDSCAAFAHRLKRFLRALPRGTEEIFAGEELGDAGVAPLKNLRDLGIVVVEHALTQPVLRHLSRESPFLSLIVARLCRDDGADSFSGHWMPNWYGTPPVWAEELWDFSRDFESEEKSRLLPRRVFLGQKIESGWIAERLGEIERMRPARPRRGLASIIIPCWNGLAYTRKCLASVLKRTDGPHEIIIVDNGSKDGTAGYVQSLKNPKIRLIKNRSNRGFPVAVNQGMRAARGDYFVWLNSDAVVTDGWLGRLVSWAERSPRVGAVGPCSNDPGISFQLQDGAPQGSDKAAAFARALAEMNSGRSTWVPLITGFCFLVKKEAVDRIGLLDERFGLGIYEDYDYCLRLRQAGYGILMAQDVFVHHSRHKTFEHNGVDDPSAAAGNRDLFIHKWCRLAMEFLDSCGNSQFFTLKAPDKLRRSL
ncbi:MAG TPA: glycosyltransferase family 2 protein [Elusimicrobiota bacterium]|nr:glycosyltransferase family 2 protein [Elusimicrobiota bacterium]